MKLHKPNFKTPHFKKIHLKMNPKKIAKFIAVLVLIITWSFLLIVIGPSKLIILFGETNSIIAFFLIGAFGGVSTLTASFFYSTLISLVRVGLDPIMLGIVGGVAISIGDSLFYYLGRSGREALFGKPKEWALTISHWLKELPKWLIPFVTFAYVGLTPLPNDVFTVSLGLAGIRYRTMILPMIAGNIFLTIVIAIIVSKGLI